MSTPAPIFQAKYTGKCASCGGDIEPGDWITVVDGWPVHGDCDEHQPAAKPREVCTVCFLEKPCPCEDDQ